MKTVNLDRKFSTTAKVAQRSTIVEGPSGRTAQATTQAEGPGGDDVLRIAQQNGGIVHASPQLVQQSGFVQGRAGPLVDQPQRQGPTGVQPQMQLPPGQTESPRPGFNRSTTAIRVVEEQPPGGHGAFRESEGGLGSERSPVQDEDGITLADLHQVMEAEQARESGGMLARNSHTQLLSDLSALEYYIIRHAAAFSLISDVPTFRDTISLEDLLDLIEAKKNNFWGKLFKGTGKEKEKIKKKGVFAVPLEILVERSGVDSILGAGSGAVRVPTFIDDVITAMKQMGASPIRTASNRLCPNG